MEVVRSLGVHEVSGFATLTDEELAAPGLGVPMRARRRILTLAGVYARQEMAAEKEKVPNPDETVPNRYQRWYTVASPCDVCSFRSIFLSSSSFMSSFHVIMSSFHVIVHVHHEQPSNHGTNVGTGYLIVYPPHTTRPPGRG